MSTDTFQPPRICPECQHKSGDGPCSTCKPYGAPCTWCIHGHPEPVDVSPEPFPLPIQLPIQITPTALDTTYVPDIGTNGNYGRWKTYHDRDVCQITHGDTRVKCVFHHQGLGRTEREAMIPRLVAAIERVIDETEGG